VGSRKILTGASENEQYYRCGYAAMAQKEGELISEHTKGAPGAAKARGAGLGGDRGYRPAVGPESGATAVARGVAVERVAHQLLLEVYRLRDSGIKSLKVSRERRQNAVLRRPKAGTRGPVRRLGARRRECQRRGHARGAIGKLEHVAV
jgi:hypothetical protein